ncbi:DUF7305 domain-containing protein [Psychromonas hadalis]|uniref:DUF7305 domain-containing protein n=1 Tax=Psychromonas hadalis TaxID=211669 RepID=UPI0003B54D8F|nr:PilX N-terminal domain-containing pilus assembly protein [Psychromonas hadalis]
MKKSQNGFVLISVLLITTISTIYAFSEIKGNLLQERIGGNQQKEMNARLMAERGVFEVFEYIQLKQGNTSRAVITAALPSAVSHAQFTISNEFYNSSAIPTYITFISTGEDKGATAYLKAKISIKPGTKKPKFEKGVVGCEGITLSGSGVIDSFNSEFGDYNSFKKDSDGTFILDGNGHKIINKGNKGNTGTVVAGANIKLSGDSPINGNVEATGSFESEGSSFVNGNVSANENITINAVNSGNSDPSVTKGLNSGGDVTVNQNAIIKGDINAKEAFNGAITNGGNTLIDGNIVAKFNNGTNTGGIYAGPDIKELECDDIGISAQVSGYEGLKGSGVQTDKNIFSNARTDADWYYTNDLTKNTHGVEFSFSSGQAEYFNDAHRTDSSAPLKLYTLASVNVDFLGESLPEVHVFDNFTLIDQDIVIDGHVKILVTGDFDAQNGSKIKVNKGSSLTIVVLGQITTDDGFRIIEVGDSTATALVDRSPVEFYSAHTSTVDKPIAIDIKGRDLSATIHAVLGHVNIGATASLKGAVRGKTVTISGGDAGDNGLETGMHYDEKLLKSTQGPGANPAIIKYASIYYHYN